MTFLGACIFFPPGESAKLAIPKGMIMPPERHPNPRLAAPRPQGRCRPYVLS